MQKVNQTKKCAEPGVTIAAKIAKDKKAMLQHVAKITTGGTISSLINVFVNAVLRYFANAGKVDHFTKCLLSTLNGFNFEKDHFTLSLQPHPEDYNITDICLFVNKKGKKETNRKPGKVPILISFDNNGNVVNTYNVDTILTLILNCIDPLIIKRIDEILQDQQLYTVTNTIKFLLCEKLKEYNMTEDIEQIFRKQEEAGKLNNTIGHPGHKFFGVKSSENDPRKEIRTNHYNDREAREIQRRLHTYFDNAPDTDELNADIDTDELNTDIDTDELNTDIYTDELNTDIDTDELNTDIDTDELNADINDYLPEDNLYNCFSDDDY